MPFDSLAKEWVKDETLPTRSHLKFDRFSLLNREELAQLARLDSVRVVAILLFDCLIISAAVFLAEKYWTPWLYALATMVIGARQFGIASVGLHDGAHGLLFKNRKLNDLVAVCLTEPLFVGLLNLHVKSYRKQHFEHHRHANDSKDPDAGFFDAWFKLPTSRRLLLLCANASGVTFLVLVLQLLRRGTWRARLIVTGVAMLLAVGVTYSLYPARLLVLYWVVPFATWGMLINTLRAVAEHYPAECAPRQDPTMDEVFLTRDVTLTWFDAWFVVTRGVNFHLTHHLFPSVPFFRLKRLHRLIAQREPYRQYAHVTPGYHQVLREVLLFHAPGSTSRQNRWIFF